MKWPKQHFDLVMILWNDAAGLRHGWAAKSETIEPYLAVSVGFLIQETGEHVRIAQDTDAEGSHNGRTQIPRGMIKKIKVLRKRDQQKPDA